MINSQNNFHMFINTSQKKQNRSQNKLTTESQISSSMAEVNLMGGGSQIKTVSKTRQKSMDPTKINQIRLEHF